MSYDDLFALNDPEHCRMLAQKLHLDSLRYVPSIDSTQDAADALAESGAPSWTLVLTDHQRSGRGQYHRSWISPAGTSLTFSVIVRPSNTAAAALLPIRTGLAVATALDAFVPEGNRVLLKWTNDLVLHNGKLGGILCEGRTQGDQLWVIVGIGINIVRFPTDHVAASTLPPVFLQDLPAPVDSRIAVLSQIIPLLRESLGNPSPLLLDSELLAYRERDWLFGRELTEPAAGIAAGITQDGHLIVRSKEGAQRTVMSGGIVLAV